MSEALDRKKLAQLNLGNLKRSQLNRTESNVTAKTRLAVVVEKQTEVHKMYAKNLACQIDFIFVSSAPEKTSKDVKTSGKATKYSISHFPTDVYCI